MRTHALLSSKKDFIAHDSSRYNLSVSEYNRMIILKPCGCGKWPCLGWIASPNLNKK